MHDYVFDLAQTTKLKLFEAAVTRVLVLDERIQRAAKSHYLNIPQKEIFQRTNVIIPDCLPLDADNYTAELSASICRFVNDHILECGFLLVHYSILERMYGSSKQEINARLIEWSKAARIVVTSGRGTPSELPTNHVCYLNLSPVLNVFTEMRSKYSINYLLNAARR
jgi:hypothetical protein